MKVRGFVFVAFTACSGGKPASPADVVAPASDSAVADTAMPTDSGGSTDSGPSMDSGAPTDSGGLAACTLGLSVQVDAEEVESGTVIHVGEAPSMAWGTTAILTLHNPCDDDLRFLGHPDEWVDGTAFSLASLPPVYLPPGESADIELSFTPAETGSYEGVFTLPYDQVGSPFIASLSATATDAVTLVMVGEGRRVSTTHDYGASFSTDTWETLTGHTDAMQRGLCYGNGSFVAVGGSASAHWWTSDDGDVWTAHTDAGGAIGDCDYGDGRFVAFDGDLLTSTDGQSWSVSPQDYAPDHLRAMVYGEDASGAAKWVAIGDQGRVAVTVDGSAWASDGHPISEDVRYLDFGIGSAGPVWVAVGSNGVIATSFDGESWTEQVVGSADWTGVVWGGDQFLVGSGSTLYRSVDGYSWSLVGTSPVVPLTHLGAMWFGVADSEILQSTDSGLSWTPIRASDGGPGYAAAAFAMEDTP